MLNYDKYLVQFSGGKDSIACLLHLLDIGVPRSRIELWHQDVDGEGGLFMDWECTESYCIAFAKAFGVPIYFQYKAGGFEEEMLRDGTRTAPINFQDANHNWHQVGGNRGSYGTRLKFPQVSPNLSVRWCSAYLKIDVCSIAIRNQPRFDGIKTLVISGERGEESEARAKYAILEPDRADNRTGKKGRYADRWRPIRDWKEEAVWGIIERYRVRVHPAYYLGFGRVSCRNCIFGNANQFASAYLVNPDPIHKIAEYEKQFGYTMKRDISIMELVAKGTPYVMEENMIALSLSNNYSLPIIMEEGEWYLPSGAYGDGCGPT